VLQRVDFLKRVGKVIRKPPIAFDSRHLVSQDQTRVGAVTLSNLSNLSAAALAIAATMLTTLTMLSNLSRLAIDILTIPAFSCECERLFSEPGDLLEPKQRKIGAMLLAALQLIRSRVHQDFTVDQEATNSYTKEEIDRLSRLDNWDAEDVVQ
jgi:hypothetical protein